ncbi:MULTISPECIES: ABC transporter permease subunit [Chelativorans]|uniref:ABC transporter permease subunit n=1 Tax=Chelativorans TaxID=449972 RepID=UPI0005A20057|nr:MULTISPECIES: ABC transporter permease subunit [Chelativorans]
MNLRSFRNRPALSLLPLVPAWVFLLLFFALPLIFVTGASIFDESGALSLQNFVRLVETPVYWRILLNTLDIAFWTACITVVVGYPLARMLASGERSGTSFLMIAIMVPLWTSFLVRALAWMLVLSRYGVINSTMLSLGLLDTPARLVNNYPAVLLAMVHGMLPLAVLTMYSVMQNIDPALSRAASTLGARSGNAFWRVYFPLSLPGVASAWLVVFVSALGTFIVPVLLGSPREMMIAGSIVEQINNNFNWGFAGALTVMLLGATLLVYLVFERTLGSSVLSGGAVSAATGSGRSGRIQQRIRPLGGRILAFVGAVTVHFEKILDSILGQRQAGSGLLLKITAWLLVAFLILPVVFVIPVSFSEDRFFSWPPVGFTTEWFATYFTSTVWMQATLNSVLFAFVSAIASMVIGIPAALVLARRSVPMRALLMMLVLMPIVLPNVIVAVGLFYIFAYVNMVGTIWAIIIGHTVLNLPYVIITVMAVLKNYDVRLDHASWTLGAGKLQTFRLVTMPILRAGITAAFLFAFVRSFDDLSIVLFLGAGQLSTLPLQLWSTALVGIDSTLAAVSTVIFGAVCIVVIVAIRIGSKK